MFAYLWYLELLAEPSVFAQLQQEEQKLLDNEDRLAAVHEHLEQSGSEEEALMASVDKVLVSLQALHSALHR